LVKFIQSWNRGLGSLNFQAYTIPSWFNGFKGWCHNVAGVV